MVHTSTMFIILEITTASGVQTPILSMFTGPSSAEAVKQATTDSTAITPTKLVTACTEERGIVNPTKGQEDIHEMHADLAGRKALNSYDWVLHPPNRTPV